MTSRGQKGELLLMAIAAIAILAVVAGMLVPMLASRLDEERLNAERINLAQMAKDFSGTFDSTSYELNEASLDQSGLPAGINFTVFDDPTALGGIVFSSGGAAVSEGWLLRLASKRGITSAVAGTSYGPRTDSELSRLAFNSYGNQRSLIAGPLNEPGRQRYMIVSVCAPGYSGLVFPGTDAATVFNSIWDQSWDSSGSQVPAAWLPFLSSSQLQAWNGPGVNQRTNASRMIVERIVQPKYTLTLANNSQTDTAWVDIGPATNAIVAAPASGVVSTATLAGFTSGILQGRLVVVRRGADVSTAAEVQRFFVYSDVNLTIQ